MPTPVVIKPDSIIGSADAGICHAGAFGGVDMLRTRRKGVERPSFFSLLSICAVLLMKRQNYLDYLLGQNKKHFGDS